MKKLASAAVLLAAAGNVLAGGLFSSNNQNPIFFRQPAQHAIVGVQGAYYDPAGVALMENGWHLSVGDQMAIQSRQVTGEYMPFMMNAENNGGQSIVYKGKTFAPVIPNIDLAYNHNRWAASFHFGVVSGGGACSFDDGLGSFEAPMALLPVAVNTLAGNTVIGGYDADIHFKGNSFAFGGQFNFAYKVIDTDIHKLSLSAGIRLNYMHNSYAGGIFDYRLMMPSMAGAMVPATNALTGILGSLGLPAPMAQTFAEKLGGDKEVDCSQNSFAVNPVFGIHYQVGSWNFAAKYEFLTKGEYTNKTSVNTAGLAQFEDGSKVRSDIPALLAFGAEVDILDNLRAAAGMNIYFDKSANYGGKQEKLGRNTLEWNLGVEYDINSKWTVSLGSQLTRFDFGENNDYLTDMSFSLPSWCLGGGFRYWFTDRIGIDVSVFNTFYDKAVKNYADYGNAGATYQAALGAVPGVPAEALAKLAVPGSDEFYRTSLSWGIGLVWDF